MWGGQKRQRRNTEASVQAMCCGGSGKLKIMHSAPMCLSLLRGRGRVLPSARSGLGRNGCRNSGRNPAVVRS